jgi:hypothetical protein
MLLPKTFMVALDYFEVLISVCLFVFFFFYELYTQWLRDIFHFELHRNSATFLGLAAAFFASLI